MEIEQQMKHTKQYTADLPEKKKILKKKTQPKPKPELPIANTTEPLTGPAHEYEEFFRELRILTRKQCK